MEKRELIDRLVDNSIEINGLEKEINELRLSLEDYRTMYTKLNHIVVKAIDYIKQFDYYIPEDNVPELLQILQGSDN